MPRILNSEQITDGSTALPVAGGAVYISEPGTTNEKTVYSDEAETIAVSQPIALDAEGRIATGLYATGKFRLQVYDATDTGSRDGVLVRDDDDLRGAGELGADALTAPLLLDDTTSVAAPPMAFDGDTDTGIAHPADDTLAGVTAGVERWRTDPSGNTGFGQSSPTERVHSDENVKADAQLIGQSLNINSVMVSTALRRSYSPTTSAQDLFDISFPTQANAACRCLVTFEDANFANGTIIWELYLATTGSGTTLDGVTIVQEDKARRASGTLTAYGTWAASISGNKVRLTHTGTVASGSGNLTILAEGRLLGVPIEEV